MSQCSDVVDSGREKELVVSVSVNERGGEEKQEEWRKKEVG